MKKIKSLTVIGVFFLLILGSAARAEMATDFAGWLAALRVEALAEGISPATFDRALAGVREPEPAVIASDRNQPEFKLNLETYLGRLVSAKRVANGRSRYKAHRQLLTEIGARYRVEPRFLLALWGIESDYGRVLGRQPIIPALVTLAYDPRRSGYFRRELLQALHLLEEGTAPLEALNGSWAGALGGLQFMPSVYRRHAVDYNGDGRVDIWHDAGDLLATGAAFLAASGWRGGQTWGREVRLPGKLAPEMLGHKVRLPLSRWQELGVRRLNGRDLPSRELDASLLRPDPEADRYFLVYDNFRVILKWNRSDLFGLAVGILADRLAESD